MTSITYPEIIDLLSVYVGECRTFHRLIADLFQFVMCKLMNKMYDKAARSLVHTDPALWTRFKVEVMKWACSVGHRACLTTARNLAREMLRNESSGSYVFSDATTPNTVRMTLNARRGRALAGFIRPLSRRHAYVCTLTLIGVRAKSRSALNAR